MNEKPINAALWTDAQGHSWTTAINVNTIKRVRELAGINLLEVFDGQLLNRLSENPELLVNTLYAVCKPQADEQSVTEEAFAERLVGDAIELASTALVQGLIGFFPKDRREVLRRLWTATGKAQTEAIRLVTNKLDAANIDATIQAVMERASDQIDRELQSLCAGSGNLQASSESIPVP